MPGLPVENCEMILLCLIYINLMLLCNGDTCSGRCNIHYGRWRNGYALRCILFAGKPSYWIFHKIFVRPSRRMRIVDIGSKSVFVSYLVGN